MEFVGALDMITLVRPSNIPYYFVNGTLPPDVTDALDMMMSDFNADYQNSPKFLSQEWDGKFHLFRQSKNGHWYFPPGFIIDVCGLLDSYGVEYKVSDKTQYQHYPIKMQWNFKGQLRAYQGEALMNIMSSGGNGVVSLPTGSGKTLVALQYAYARGERFIILVHRKELVDQWDREIRKILGIVPEIVGEGVGELSKGPCVIAMIQTLHRWLKDRKIENISGFSLAVYDECHILAADSVQRVSHSLNTKWSMGLSATPWRSDNLQLKIFGSVGPLMSDVQVPDLIDMGYLAKPLFYIFQAPSTVTAKWDDWHGVYLTGIVQNEMRNEMAAAAARKFMEEGRQVYIHVNQIRHGKTIARLIPEARFVSAATKSRDKDISGFRNGHYQCLVSTLLKEGVDIPAIDALIFAAGYKSEVFVIQTIGRAMRVKKDGGNAVIVDFNDTGHRYLSEHSQARMNVLDKVYGKYFLPKSRLPGVV
jgi:superfamily II DNA or RNA helicase